MTTPGTRSPLLSPGLLSITLCTLLSACNQPTAVQPDQAQLGAAAVTAAADTRLTWRPPIQRDTITLSKTGQGQCNPTPKQCVLELDNIDYQIILPKTGRFERGLFLVGGHNITIIGGEIWIPMQNSSLPKQAFIEARTGMKIKNATGTVHIEGVRMRGPDISEGIQIEAPLATVQLQNIRIDNIHARNTTTFADNHPDLIQTYGNVALLRVDRFTGSTDYQGLFFSADNGKSHGKVTLKNVNIIGNQYSRQLLWFRPDPKLKVDQVQNNLSEVYLDYTRGTKGELAFAVFPDKTYDPANTITKEDDGLKKENFRAILSPGGTVSWPSVMTPRVTGNVDPGRPPGGDFVPNQAPNGGTTAGLGYKSPGYR